MSVQDSVRIFSEKFGQAWTACLVCMVQGDLSVLSLHHAITASKTGGLTGIAMVVAALLPWDSKWIGVFLTGVFAMLADMVTHPSHFGGHWTEALLTGFGAMVLCIIYERLRDGKEKQRA